MQGNFTKIIGISLALTLGLMGVFYYLHNTEQNSEAEMLEAPIGTFTGADGGKIIDGLDEATGFVAEGDYLLVKASCTPCHSAKLVTQNRATREGWLEMIRWMQETQKLWDLQPNEDKILDYLATYYAPENEGRRRPLEVEEWYVIE